MKSIYKPVIEMARHYAKATGVSVRVFDSQVHEIYQEKTNWLSCHHCPYGQGGENHAVSGCVKSKMLNVNESRQFAQSQVYGCQSGFIFWMSFVMLEGKSLASIVAGLQVAYHSPSLNRPPQGAGEILMNLGAREREKIEGLSQILLLSSQAISQRYNYASLGEREREPQKEPSPYDELLNSISGGREEPTQRLLRSIFKNFSEETQGNPEAIKNLCLNLVLFLRQAFESKKTWNHLGLSIPLLPLFERVSQSQELLEWLYAVVEDLYHKPLLNLTQGRYSFFLESTLEYIHDNFSRDIDLKQVSAKLGLSESYFSRLFKSEMEMGFVEYLNSLRISESKRLLRFSNKDLLTIAKLCGFSDQSYFTKIFKKIEGVSPGRYRRAMIAS